MKRTLILTAAVLALATGAAQAASSTVVTETRLVHKPVAGANVVDFRQFDADADGRLTRDEVGVKLFESFDKNNNHLIDNIEFDTPMVMTFAPMERQTIQFVYHDGNMTQQTATQDVFMQQTGLSRFDPTGMGLSASKFIEQPIKQVDRDGSGQIDIREWQEAYNASLKPLPVNDTFRYND